MQAWGERAEALRVAADAQQASASVTGQPQPSASGGATSGFEFSFPVELPGQSTQMSIEWNRGEDGNTIAERFLSKYNLPVSHLGDVRDPIPMN